MGETGRGKDLLIKKREGGGKGRKEWGEGKRRENLKMLPEGREDVGCATAHIFIYIYKEAPLYPSLFSSSPFPSPIHLLVPSPTFETSPLHGIISSRYPCFCPFPFWIILGDF